MGTINMKYVMKVTARGKIYYYFRYRGDRWPLPDPQAPGSKFAVEYARLKNAVEKEESEKPTGHPPGSVAWLIQQYFRTPKYLKMSRSSKRNTDYHLEIVAKKWSNIPVHAIRVQDVYQLIDEYADRPGTTVKLLAAASKLMNFGIKMELRDANPVAAVERPDLGEHEAWPIWLLQKALDSEDNLFRRAVAVHYYTGQRTSDCCRIAWNAIDGGIIRSRQMKKRDKPHTIPIHAALAAELAASPRKTVTILETNIGGSLTSNTFRRWCRKFCKANEVEGYSPHGLRKNAVTVLIELGCSSGQVASITDQTLATIEKYAKSRDNVIIARQAMGIWERG